MNTKKITKEELEAKLPQQVKKPGFSQWLLHDKKAFQITYIIGCLGGVLVMLALLIVSLILDFNLAFQVLFGLLLLQQCWASYKVIKNRKYMESSINDLAYKGKYDKTQYTQQKGVYDSSKGVPS